MTVNPSRTTRLILILLLLAAAMTGVTIALSTFSKPGSATNAGEKPLLTEFGDFQCPYCASFARFTLPALERDLIGPGTVHFEYRHYPFLGPESFSAAEASECARDQGRFREYHDELFELTAQDEKLTPENLNKIAYGLELDPTRFNQCMENREKQAQVLADREYGSSLGVLGTPALFMNGQQLRWQKYPSLRQQIMEHVRSRESNATSVSPGTPGEGLQP